MFKITWDKETGGVKLSSKIVEGTLGVSPRPVFFEELDLLGLNKLPDGKAWQYPHCKEPLLWACNKQYYYHGELVFEARGANIYDLAKVELSSNAYGLVLEPVHISEMLERNKDEMFLIESEALEFIRDTYVKYSSNKRLAQVAKANKLDYEALAEKAEKRSRTKMAIVKEDCDSFDIMPLDIANEKGKSTYATTQKIDCFLASFSGGKDSQVVLDLCTRAIPSQAFEVIYSDTGYELPPSLNLYTEIQDYYHQKFPDLKFSTTKNHESVLNYWDKIGTPSDKHRWCCSVMKTAPLYRSLKLEGNKQARVLTFDGVRAEESTRRAGYNRIGKGVKHDTVINASPLLHWTTTEIFLYLLKYNLPINIAYRQGMTRVGCLICPFSSEWNDMVSHTCYPDKLKPFLGRIEKVTEQAGIKDSKEYIKQGNWKRRAGGRGISFPSYTQVQSIRPNLVLIVKNPQKDILTWLYAVGKYSISNEGSLQYGELIFKKKIYKFIIEKYIDEYKVTFENVDKEPVLVGLLKRAFYKSTYCINCEACEVECPTGALTILPTPRISNKCIHCHQCLTFHEFGCITAHSLAQTINDGNKMKLTGYNNFGMREDWVEYFMMNIDTYFKDNSHGLHPKEQLPSFVKWLVQSGILVDAKNKNVSELGYVLSGLYENMPEVVWEVIWINLSYNSPIAIWYKENVEWDSEFTESYIRDRVMNDYPGNSSTTVKNVVYAFFRTLRESPIGRMGILAETSRLHYIKSPYNELTSIGAAYSLYRYAEVKGIKSIRLSDLFSYENKQGVFREFGISKSAIEYLLRTLNSDKNRLVVAELNMGLDNITLRDDITSLDVLKLIKDE